MGATPLTLRCPRCKNGREWRHDRGGYDSESHKNLVPTGKKKTIARTSAGVLNVVAVQMKHDGHNRERYCGHVFWTTHPDGVRKLLPNAVPCGNASSRYMRDEPLCHICGKNSPRCDRGVYLAHGNGGAYSVAAAHKKCVIAAGEVAQDWNEELGWYVRGAIPKLKDVSR